MRVRLAGCGISATKPGGSMTCRPAGREQTGAKPRSPSPTGPEAGASLIARRACPGAGGDLSAARRPAWRKINPGRRRGQRHALRGLSWREVDFDGAAIRLPAERAKNKEGRMIPLSPAALPLLAEPPRFRRRRVCLRTGWSGALRPRRPRQGAARPRDCRSSRRTDAAVAVARHPSDCRHRTATARHAPRGHRGRARSRFGVTCGHRGDLPAAPLRG